jgi:hypothetical protein
MHVNISYDNFTPINMFHTSLLTNNGLGRNILQVSSMAEATICMTESELQV